MVYAYIGVDKKMKVIITEAIHDDGIKYLKRFAEVDCKFGISRIDLISNICNYDGIIVRSDTKIDRKIIDAGNKLKTIGMAGIGLNHIDVDYAIEKKITVYNVQDGSNDSVAELTIALMLNIVRKINPAVNSVKLYNEWDKYGYTGRQLKGMVMGIIALGKIGSRVATMCKTIGMKVIAFDPYTTKEKAATVGVDLVDFNELMARADVISIHAPLTKDTYHLIGEKQINKMKKGAFLLNLGRGGIIDEGVLYKALKDGHLAGAAVDVMEKEPPGQSRLFKLENFIVTPHIGAGTVEAQQYISMSIVKKVLSGITV